MAAKPPAPKGGKGGSLEKKVGPFPVWGWGVVLLAGVGLALYLRRRAGAAGTSGVAAPATTSDTTTPTVAPGAQGQAQTAADSGGGSFDFGSALDSLIGANTSLAESQSAAGIQAEAQSFDFAQSVFGSALDFATANHYSGAGGPGASSAPAPGPGPAATPTFYTGPIGLASGGSYGAGTPIAVSGGSFGGVALKPGQRIAL